MPRYKTSEAQRRANKNHAQRIDRIMVNAPKGTKERIESLTDESASGFIKRVVLAELDRLEKEKTE